MKKTWIIVLPLIIILFAGCHTNQQADTSASDSDAAKLTWAELTANDGILNTISLDSLSQDVYSALQQEWDSWNLLSQEQQLASSHMPGVCGRGFDDWSECEIFLGISVPNPLEECSWLENATYVAMPIGFQDAPRIQAIWSGTEDGQVESVHVQAGYRNDQIRVMISATLYEDSAKIEALCLGWQAEPGQQNDPADMDDAPLQVISDSTETYYSNMFYKVYGNLVYCFHIVGESDEQAQVESTLEQLLDSILPESKQ